MVKRVKNEELKLALERNAILLAELAKVESRVARGHDPAVKSRRKQNKKQVELKVEQFISKTKPKDQLTERLQGARIKLALDNQYNKLIEQAQGKRKADIGKIASESQDVKLDKAHIEGKKQEKLLLLKANEDAKQDAKDARNNLLMDKLQRIEDKRLLIEEKRDAKQDARDKHLLLKANEDAKQDAKDARNNLLMDKLQRIEDKRLLIEEKRDAKQDARDKQMLLLLKDDNNPKFQTPMMATPMKATRGRPTGSMSKSKSVTLDDGTIDTTLDREGIIALKAIAKTQGINIKGLTNKEDIKRAILVNSVEVKPQRLFATIEEEVNEPRQNPYYSNLPVDEDESTRTKNFIDKSAPPRSEKSVVMQKELEDKKERLELLQQKKAKRQQDAVIPQPPTTPITPSVAKVKLSRVQYDKAVEDIDAIKDKKTVLDYINQLGIEIPEELQKELKAPKQGNKHSNQLKKLLKNHYEPEDASSTEKFERKLTKREQLSVNEGLTIEQLKHQLDIKGIPYKNEKEKALRTLLNNSYKTPK